MGYSPRHKGVKCLDVTTGWVYISRDVVFDEAVFPFKTLRPNAGALLRKEILLLDPSLHPCTPENEQFDDTHDDFMHATNHVQSAPFLAPQGPAAQHQDTPQNSDEIDASSSSNMSHEMLVEEETCTGHEIDSLPGSPSGSSPGSASG
jgi:hypothetical protein